MKRYCYFLLLTIYASFPLLVKAEIVEESTGGWQFSTTMGPVLISGVTGVEDAVSSVTAELAAGIDYFLAETSFTSGNSNGITYQRLFFSFGNNMELTGVEFFWRAGINATRLKRDTAIVQDSDFQQFFGWHYSFGTYIPVNERVKVKGLTSLAIRPSRIVYVGIGLTFLLGGESSGDEEN